MMRACVIMGVVGLSAPAFASGNWAGLEVRLTFDRTSIGIGETATGTVVASWADPFALYLAWVNIDLTASGGFVEVSGIAPVLWNNPLFGLPGQPVASGANVLDVAASQLSLFQPFDMSNPLAITSFTVTGVAAGVLTYESVTSRWGSDSFFLPHPPTGAPDLPPIGNEAFVSGTLSVTPGPGVVGVIVIAGVGGLGRRRRRGGGGGAAAAGLGLENRALRGRIARHRVLGVWRNCR